jgi:hypothetical protein
MGRKQLVINENTEKQTFSKKVRKMIFSFAHLSRLFRDYFLHICTFPLTFALQFSFLLFL